MKGKSISDIMNMGLEKLNSSHNSLVLLDREARIVYKSFGSYLSESKFEPNLIKNRIKFAEYKDLKRLTNYCSKPIELSVSGEYFCLEFIPGDTLSYYLKEKNVNITEVLSRCIALELNIKRNLSKMKNKGGLQNYSLTFSETAHPYWNFLTLTHPNFPRLLQHIMPRQKHLFGLKVDKLACEISQDENLLSTENLILGDFKPDNIIINNDYYFIDPLLSLGNKYCDLAKLLSRLILNCNLNSELITSYINEVCRIYDYELDVQSLKIGILADMLNFLSLNNFRQNKFNIFNTAEFRNQMLQYLNAWLNLYETNL